MWDFDAIQNEKDEFEINKTLEGTIKEAISASLFYSKSKRYRVLSKVKVNSPYGEFNMTEY
jgi:hypothetical protein